MNLITFHFSVSRLSFFCGSQAGNDFVNQKNNHKCGNHAEYRMGEKVLPAVHLIEGGRPADSQSESQPEPAFPRRVKAEKQRHKGEAGGGMSGRKTAPGFGLNEVGGIAFQNADERIKPVINVQLVGAVNVGDIFGTGNEGRDENDA